MSNKDVPHFLKPTDNTLYKFNDNADGRAVNTTEDIGNALADLFNRLHEIATRKECDPKIYDTANGLDTTADHLYQALDKLNHGIQSARTNQRGHGGDIPTDGFKEATNRFLDRIPRDTDNKINHRHQDILPNRA